MDKIVLKQIDKKAKEDKEHLNNTLNNSDILSLNETSRQNSKVFKDYNRNSHVNNTPITINENYFYNEGDHDNDMTVDNIHNEHDNDKIDKDEKLRRKKLRRLIKRNSKFNLIQLNNDDYNNKKSFIGSFIGIENQPQNINQNIPMFHIHQYSRRDITKMIKSIDDKMEMIISSSENDINKQLDTFHYKYNEKVLKARNSNIKYRSFVIKRHKVNKENKHYIIINYLLEK